MRFLKHDFLTDKTCFVLVYIISVKDFSKMSFSYLYSIYIEITGRKIRWLNLKHACTHT